MGRARLLILAVLFFATGSRADGMIEVCPTCEVGSVSQAVGMAREGGTIRVGPGIYREKGIEITKPLRIQGYGSGEQDRPVIDGEGGGNILLVRSPGVTISGLVLRNTGLSYTEDVAAIKVDEVGECEIRDNVFEKTHYSILLGKTRKCLIEGNRLSGEKRSESMSGNGIHVWYGQDLTIRNNRIEGHRDGIYFEFVKNSRIEANEVRGNLRYGLHFMFSNHDEYLNNRFIENGSGVAVMYSKGIRMIGNRFEKSWGGASYGALLKDISESEIRGNTFRQNTVGVFMEGSTRSRLEENRFEENGWGIRILGSSDSNVVTRNDFIANTFEASTNANSSMNTFVGNYWSGYRGVDVDRDGIGDSPYRPVRLSSVLMERYGVSVLLLKSFFFAAADEAEALLPILTPESFRDDRPRMKEVVK